MGFRYVPPVVRKRKGIGAGIVFSAVLAFAAMVMVVVCIQAGATPGDNEDMYMALLNTSDFGQDLLPSLLQKMEEDLKNLVPRGLSPIESSSKRDVPSGLSARFLDEFIDDAKDKGEEYLDSVTSALDDSLDKVKDLADGFTGKLSEKLGIPDFFTLHVKDVCWGNFNNASSLECSPAKPGYNLNLDQYLDMSLTAGPLNISLAYLVSEDTADNIRDASNAISTFVTAVFALFTIAASSAAMVVILSVASYFHLAVTEKSADHPSLNRWLLNFNLTFSVIGALAMILAAACSTGAMDWAHDQLVDVGKTLNISFNMGMKFITIAWVAAGFMILVLLINVFIVVRARKERKGSDTESNFSVEKIGEKPGILSRFYRRR